LDGIKFFVRDFFASVHDGICSSWRISFAPMRSKFRALLTEVKEWLEMGATFLFRTVPEKNA
jgi:hypothetical protein